MKLLNKYFKWLKKIKMKAWHLCLQQKKMVIDSIIHILYILADFFYELLADRVLKSPDITVELSISSLFLSFFVSYICDSIIIFMASCFYHYKIPSAI
jgi:hypothetical protein